MKQVFLAYHQREIGEDYDENLLAVCASKEIAQAHCEEARRSMIQFYRLNPLEAQFVEAIEQAEWDKTGMNLWVKGVPMNWFINRVNFYEELP